MTMGSVVESQGVGYCRYQGVTFVDFFLSSRADVMLSLGSSRSPR